MTTPVNGPDRRLAGGQVDVEGLSVGDLLANVSRDLMTLIRQEFSLAKAEMKDEASKVRRAAGMLGAAGFAGCMVLLFLSLALWGALSNLMDQGWAALIIAAVWAAVGAVLYATGRSEMRNVNPKPERTVDTVKQVPQALTPNQERS